MARVILAAYSRYTALDGTEFRPELRDGLYVAVAQVTDPEKLEGYRKRPAFVVEEDAQAAEAAAVLAEAQADAGSAPSGAAQEAQTASNGIASDAVDAEQPQAEGGAA